jgi:hypothetical protein
MIGSRAQAEPMTTTGARVQIAVVRVRDAFVEERHGLPGRQRFRAAITPPLREALASGFKPPGGWVGFDLFIEANVVADRLFGRGDLALAWEMGHFAASHNVGVWKSIFMRHLRPAMVLGLTSGLWSSHYDGGRIMSRSTGDTSMIVSILDFPVPHRAHCLAIGGWLLGTLELGPRKDIQVQELACRCLGGTSCDFRLSWA